MTVLTLLAAPLEAASQWIPHIPSDSSIHSRPPRSLIVSELLPHILSVSDRPSLARCLCVSKSFGTTTAPLRYHNINSTAHLHILFSALPKSKDGGKLPLRRLVTPRGAQDHTINPRRSDTCGHLTSTLTPTWYDPSEDLKLGNTSVQDSPDICGAREQL